MKTQRWTFRSVDVSKVNWSSPPTKVQIYKHRGPKTLRSSFNSEANKKFKKKKVPKKWQSERETEIDYGLSDWTNMFKYDYGNQSNSINEHAFII